MKQTILDSVYTPAVPSVERKHGPSRRAILVRAEDKELSCLGLLPILERVLSVSFRSSRRSESKAPAEIVFEHEAGGRALSEDAGG
jgi:hypothetical protein